MKRYMYAFAFISTFTLSQFYYDRPICNRGHYIFVMWFLPSVFFPRLYQPLQIGCLPYFDTWCDPRANLECRSETCCTRLAGNAGRKKIAKMRHLGTIAQICWAISSQLARLRSVGEFGASKHISTGFASWQRYCTAL